MDGRKNGYHRSGKNVRRKIEWCGKRLDTIPEFTPQTKTKQIKIIYPKPYRPYQVNIDLLEKLARRA